MLTCKLSMTETPQGNAPLNASEAIFDVYSNTFVDYSTSGHASDASGQGDRTNEDIANNITYQPNGGTTSHSNITQTTIAAVPLNIGRRQGPDYSQTTIGSWGVGATIDVPLPSGVTDADYATGDDHIIRVAGQAYSVGLGHFTVTKLGTSNVRLTNTSSSTIAGGTLYLSIAQNNLTTDPAFAVPTTVYLPVPDTNSDARRAASGKRGHFDFNGNARNGPSETGLDLFGNPMTDAADDVGAFAIG